ncbi:MAG: SDR family oxidoreductase, partial [Gaiellales bacterium]
VRGLAQVEAMVAACVERFGGLDILVVNAGVGAYGDFLDLKPEWLDEMIDTNVKGFLHTIRAGLPRLLESSSADLVAVTSIAGQRAPEGEAVYAASKHAQIGFMRSLDHELFRRGVRCSILAPGGVETAFAMGRGRTPEDPDLPGMLRSEEVADAVMYAVTRPRTGRIFEASILPMADDSMG